MKLGVNFCSEKGVLVVKTQIVIIFFYFQVYLYYHLTWHPCFSSCSRSSMHELSARSTIAMTVKLHVICDRERLSWFHVNIDRQSLLHVIIDCQFPSFSCDQRSPTPFRPCVIGDRQCLSDLMWLPMPVMSHMIAYACLPPYHQCTPPSNVRYRYCTVPSPPVIDTGISISIFLRCTLLVPYIGAVIF
jgi:hypothetical protein